MQDRLMRSRHDRMVAGVCGGLGRYFEIDPTIVRLVMVLMIFTGIGVVLYGALWLVMPSELPGSGPLPPRDSFGQPPGLSNTWRNYVPPASYDPRGGDPSVPLGVPTPDSGRFRYDPYTGQPLPAASQAEAPQAYTGDTIQVENHPGVVPPPFAQQPIAPPGDPHIGGPAAPRRNSRPVLGIILVAVGVLAIANNIGIGDFIFPLLLVGIGFVLLMRPGRRP